MAALNGRPKMRDDIVIRRLSSRNETYVVVKDPVAQKYYKFEPWEQDLLELMDGTRDLEELAAAFEALRPEFQLDIQWVADYVDSQRESGLLERTEQEKHLVMMDKMKTLRKRRFHNAEVRSVFQIEFKLFDPNDWMDLVMPWIRWLWSGWFIGLVLAVSVFVIGFLIYHWDLYWAGFFGLIHPEGKTFWDWVGLFALIFAISIWHELGHGLTCKAFGGEVHNIGFMIFYFEPAFYCNIDDSYLFSRLSHRIYSALGGIYFEALVCAVALAAWLLTPAEWWVHGLALMLVFITGLGALFNLHPLIKLDGYYILMDWLDMPDLRENSFEYMQNVVKKHVFHLNVPERAIPRRHRRVFLIYGVSAMVYTALILLLIYSMFKQWVVGWFGPFGYLIIFALVMLMMQRKLSAGVRFMRHLYLDKRELILSPRGKLIGGFVVLAGLILLTVPHSATRIGAAFVVEPGARAVIRAPADGILERVFVDEGSVVQSGEMLAVLTNPDLEAASQLASSDFERFSLQASRARRDRDIAAAREWAEEAIEADTRRTVADRKQRRQTLLAPIRGIVTTRDLDHSLGKYFVEGETVCTVDQLDTVLLEIATPESDIESVREGVEVRMMAKAFPGRTFTASVVAVAPMARPPLDEQAQALDLVHRVNLVRVLVEIENQDHRLRPGMTGKVQLLGDARSPLGKAWWHFRRWAGTIVW